MATYTIATSTFVTYESLEEAGAALNAALAAADTTEVIRTCTIVPIEGSQRFGIALLTSDATV